MTTNIFPNGQNVRSLDDKAYNDRQDFKVSNA